MKKFLAMIVTIVLLAFLVAVPAFAAEEIIVDDNENGGEGFTKTAGWAYWTPDGEAGDCNYITAGDGSEYCEYKPTLSKAGKYEVYAKWVPQDVRGTNVPYIITYKGGSETVEVDQTEGGIATKTMEKWELLGTYEFEADGTASVKITNETNGVVVADAVKFVLVGGDAASAGTASENPKTGDAGLMVFLAAAAASGAGLVASKIRNKK